MLGEGIGGEHMGGGAGSRGMQGRQSSPWLRVVTWCRCPLCGSLLELGHCQPIKSSKVNNLNHPHKSTSPYK